MSSEYSQVPSQDVDSTTSAGGPSSVNSTNNNNNRGNNGSGSSHPQQAPTQQDGVFANIPAKPQAIVVGKVYEELEPPSYHEVSPMMQDSSLPPQYYYATTAYENTIIPVVDEDGDVVIHGLPVGTLLLFFANLFLSASFDFIGYLLTTLFSTTHAAKYGSRSGLGLTLMRIGLLMKMGGGNLEDFDGDDDGRQGELEHFGMGGRPDHHRSHSPPSFELNLFSYLFMFTGFWMTVSANAQFLQVYRMKSVILSAAAQTSTNRTIFSIFPAAATTASPTSSSAENMV